MARLRLGDELAATARSGDRFRLPAGAFAKAASGLCAAPRELALGEIPTYAASVPGHSLLERRNHGNQTQRRRHEADQ